MDEQRSPSRARATSEEGYVCDRCGEPMEERQCTIVCLNCGMARDSSDP